MPTHLFRRSQTGTLWSRLTSWCKAQVACHCAAAMARPSSYRRGRRSNPSRKSWIGCERTAAEGPVQVGLPSRRLRTCRNDVAPGTALSALPSAVVGGGHAVDGIMGAVGPRTGWVSSRRAGMSQNRPPSDAVASWVVDSLRRNRTPASPSRRSRASRAVPDRAPGASAATLGPPHRRTPARTVNAAPTALLIHLNQSWSLDSGATRRDSPLPNPRWTLYVAGALCQHLDMSAKSGRSGRPPPSPASAWLLCVRRRDRTRWISSTF